MEPMTEQEIEELARLCEQATPGPWRWSQCYELGGYDGSDGDIHWALVSDESEKEGRVIDAALVLLHAHPDWMYRKFEELPNVKFIAAARAVMPRLIAEVRQLRRELDVEKFVLAERDTALVSAAEAYSKLEKEVRQARAETTR